MIKVLKPGVQLTIQDGGRCGYRHLGVSQAGCLDPYAQIIANKLVGNKDNEAVLEVTLGLCELQFETDTVIALQGADLNAALDETPLYPGWSYQVRAKQTLSFDTGRAGLRAYVAVQGGIDVKDIMGSKSTDLNALFGGLAGKALSEGDMIPIKTSPVPITRFIQRGAITPPKLKVIRVHASPHAQLLGDTLLKQFFSTAFKVSHNSNRMGLRLTNESPLTHSHSLASLGTGLGSIQLPPSGEPIVLLNDAQTTGGYPLLGTVIEADLHQFAQFRPGDSIEFKQVTHEQASLAKQKLKGHLHQLSLALKYS
ncbi:MULTISPECIES: biotin-dependent carboxyltransferase family protein [unclassified Pseudoalteromonas]|uniref:5-oxoprolinase subunit C family protein n=1 Tax=unclassified Pseudoalteromonas TaxID=194690 RepID=UPI002358BCD9|nr:MULTISPECIES: biotin-dependent carboxyltransferase family protein [unclassified Pseudoalteromonas]MDC9564255.1 biotin-dependent carboxyltransferase family protein [Pseudoalteromonas sp. GAB2316C]MDC9568713.1 biotin-dependent carboxyltransferase family protein [Pseudoalteromonas sp. GABNB9D]MDC9572978.1 biotin-dependent carboxyltransferase family protein [Pseudoalteromonas sp. GABNS16A]MDC9577115.1 biotin-dependent carboxyltransferase family protein [Pseudoalteromonas sp. GABNS16E]MDC9584699